MSIGSTAKQIFWKFVVAREPIYPSTALAITFFNTLLNTLNTLAYNASADNPTYFPPWSIYVGAALFATGILTETISELQRNSVKKDSKNDGGLCCGGWRSALGYFRWGLLSKGFRHKSYSCAGWIHGKKIWRAVDAGQAEGPQCVDSRHMVEVDIVYLVHR